MQNLLHNDPNPHVRSVAARTLSQIQEPRALELLKAALNGECQVTASGAALGLRNLKPMTAEVIGILKSKAKLLLEKSSPDSRAPLLSALIGSLEVLVHEVWEAEREKKSNDVVKPVRALLRDAEIGRIFLSALEQPSAQVKASAVSKGPDVSVVDGGARVVIHFALQSGSFFDQRRGWLTGNLVTKQIRK